MYAVHSVANHPRTMTTVLNVRVTFGCGSIQTKSIYLITFSIFLFFRFLLVSLVRATQTGNAKCLSANALSISLNRGTAFEFHWIFRFQKGQLEFHLRATRAFSSRGHEIELHKRFAHFYLSHRCGDSGQRTRNDLVVRRVISLAKYFASFIFSDQLFADDRCAVLWVTLWSLFVIELEPASLQSSHIWSSHSLSLASFATNIITRIVRSLLAYVVQIEISWYAKLKIYSSNFCEQRYSLNGILCTYAV